MKRKRFNWNSLLKLGDKYRTDAEKCLRSRAYFAGLVAVRAALETMLIARFLLEVMEWSTKKRKQFGITVRHNVIEVHGEVRLYELIHEAYRQGLIDKSGWEAANRIREWGNKIHCGQVAGGKKLPVISGRNLKARLNDLNVVYDQLLRTI